MRASFDVVVAGLGIAGAAVAHQLALRGVRVLGVDARRPPHSQGSSHGETRIIRQAYFEHPAYVPLVQQAYSMWRTLEKAAGRQLLLETGGLMIGPPEGTLVSGALASARDHSLEHALLGPAGLERRFPRFRSSRGIAAVWEPRAGVLLAEPCVSTLLAAAAQYGATLRTGVAFQGWDAWARGVRLRLGGETVHTRALVLALGSWMGGWLPALPLEVERQVQLWFPSSRPARGAPQRDPVFIWETGPGRLFYGIPDVGNGFKVARHHAGETGPRQELGSRVTNADSAPVAAFVGRRLRAVGGKPLRGSVCRYTNTPDGHFIAHRLSGAPVWALSACSGHGFKFAPALATHLAGWVIEGERPAALRPFALGRFRGSGTDPLNS